MILGGGPSLSQKLKQISQSDYDGYLLISDTQLKKVITVGITPDRFNMIVFTIENISIFYKLFEIEKYHQELIEVVASHRTHANTMDYLIKNYSHIHRYEWRPLEYVSNVGLMAFVYAWRKLKLEHIELVGMDHCDYQKTGIPCFNENSTHYSLFYKDMINPHTKTKCYLDPIHQLWHEQFFDFLELAPKNLKITNHGDGVLFGDRIGYA